MTKYFEGLSTITVNLREQFPSPKGFLELRASEGQMVSASDVSYLSFLVGNQEIVNKKNLIETFTRQLYVFNKRRK